MHHYITTHLSKHLRSSVRHTYQEITRVFGAQTGTQFRDQIYISYSVTDTQPFAIGQHETSQLATTPHYPSFSLAITSQVALLNGVLTPLERKRMEVEGILLQLGLLILKHMAIFAAWREATSEQSQYREKAEFGVESGKRVPAQLWLST